MEFKINDPAKALKHFEAKLHFSTGPLELSHALKEGTELTIIDVRSSEDFIKGHLPGALNLPQDSWASLEGLTKNRLNILYCYSQVCHLAAHAAVIFASAGYPVMELDGGIESWKAQNLKLVRPHKAAKYISETHLQH